MSGYDETLKKKYQDRIKVVEKSPTELENYLKDVAYVEQITIEKVNQGPLGVVCAGYVEDLVGCGYSADMLDWAAYELKPVEKNKKYYEDIRQDCIGWVEDEPVPDIIVVFEKSTGWITSNCQMLLLELLLAKGIPQYDYDNETPIFKGYLVYLEGYLRRCHMQS